MSAFLWDFNPFTFEITKEFFDENSGEEGEGSNRQNNNDNNNNNIPNQDSSISPSYNEEALEEELMEDPEVTKENIIWEELFENERERKSLVQEIRSISQNKSQ